MTGKHIFKLVIKLLQSGYFDQRAWLGVIGPVVMTTLLRRVSGVTLLEKSLVKRRPGYEDYVRRTSPFLPRPPRK